MSPLGQHPCPSLRPLPPSTPPHLPSALVPPTAHSAPGCRGISMVRGWRSLHGRPGRAGPAMPNLSTPRALPGGGVPSGVTVQRLELGAALPVPAPVAGPGAGAAGAGAAGAAGAGAAGAAGPFTPGSLCSHNPCSHAHSPPLTSAPHVHPAPPTPYLPRLLTPSTPQPTANAPSQPPPSPAPPSPSPHPSMRLALVAAAIIGVATVQAAFTSPALASGFAAAAAVAPEAVGPSAASKALAVGLGWAVLLGSCFRSLPQILKMVKAKSAEGLSLTSIATETLCYTVTIAYNINHGYPFNTYGDTVACWLQDLVIFGLMVGPMALPPLVIGAVATAFAALSTWLFCGGVSIATLEFLQCSNVVFSLIGVKAPQIWLNMKRGDTGMLSLTTCILNVIGNVVRVYTTLILTRDMIILAAYVMMMVLNMVLLWQTLGTKTRAMHSSRAAGMSSGGGGGQGEAKERGEGYGGQGALPQQPA